jgi:predicted PurR-regulated permease PerM
VTDPLATAMQRRSRVGGWAIVAVLTVLAVLLYAVRYALLPFVFAVAIAFVTDPLIKGLQRRLGSPRWAVAIVLYIILLTVLGGTVYWVGTLAFADFLSVASHSPEILRHLIEQAVSSEGLTFFGQTYRPDQLVQEAGDALRSVLGVGAVTQIAGMTLSAIFGSFLLLVLTPYFMVSGPRLAAGAIWLIPPERRHSVEVLLPRLIPPLRRYLIGMFLVVVYTSTLAWVGFGLIFHLPHAVLLAITVGLLELIPVVGPLSSATLVGITAVQQASIWSTVFLMAYAIGLRLSIDNLVGPLVLGQAARIHPVVVIISFVCGAMLFGVVGLLLAVPVVVCVKTALEHYYAEPVEPSARR